MVLITGVEKTVPKANQLTLLGLPEALDESHGLTLKPAGHPAPSARVHKLRELLKHHRVQEQGSKKEEGPASTHTPFPAHAIPRVLCLHQGFLHPWKACARRECLTNHQYTNRCIEVFCSIHGRHVLGGNVLPTINRVRGVANARAQAPWLPEIQQEQE